MKTPETRPYFEAVEEFLRELQEHSVTSLCMVALCSDEDTYDVISQWNSGPFEMASMAGIIQMHSTLMYIDANDEESDLEE